MMPKFLTKSASVTNSTQNSRSNRREWCKRLFFSHTLAHPAGRARIADLCTPTPPHHCIMKKHLCSYSLHQPNGLGKQRGTNLTRQRLKHTDPISNLSGQAVSLQQLCVLPHVRCRSSAKRSQVRQPERDAQQQLVLFAF